MKAIFWGDAIPLNSKQEPSFLVSPQGLAKRLQPGLPAWGPGELLVHPQQWGRADRRCLYRLHRPRHLLSPLAVPILPWDNVSGGGQPPESCQSGPLCNVP